MGLSFVFFCAGALVASLLRPVHATAQVWGPPSEKHTQGPASLDSVSLEPTATQLLRDIARHQKRIWAFPLRVGEHLPATLAVTSATAVLITLDPHVSPYFGKSRFDGYKQGLLSKKPMAVMIGAFPAITYATGLLRNDNHAKGTGLLAAEAAADTLVVSTALKAIMGRRFPGQIPKQGDFTRTWFQFTGPAHDPGSFPSSHAMSAFAVAAVYASRYKQRRWVPLVAYGLASLASISRIPDQTHFPSDVFAGAAAGYAIGHFVVLRD